MAKKGVFEPDPKGTRQVFDQSTSYDGHTGRMDVEGEVDAILKQLNAQNVDRMIEEKLQRMDEPTRKKLLREAGSVGSFIAGVKAKMIADKLTAKYGPSVLKALGIGSAGTAAAIGSAGTAAASGGAVLSSLSPEHQELFRPFFENSPLLQAMTSSNAQDVAAVVDPSDVAEGVGRVFEWLGDLLSSLF